MSNISQFGGGAIKSIQRGTINATAGGATATISAVNTSKTELRFLGGGDYMGVTGYPVFARVVLTNSTTVTATASNSNGGICTVSWELTEFY